MRISCRTARARIGAHHSSSAWLAAAIIALFAPRTGAWTATMCVPVASARSIAQSRARAAPSEPSSPTMIGPSGNSGSPRSTTTGHELCSTHSWDTDPSSNPAKPPSPRAPRTSMSALVLAATPRSTDAAGPRPASTCTRSAPAPSSSRTTVLRSSRVRSSISSGPGNRAWPAGFTARAGYCQAATARSSAP